MKQLIPSALGSLRKYDAWVCQGSVFKWATIASRPPLQARGQLFGTVWALHYWEVLASSQKIEDGKGGKGPLCASGVGALG